MRPPPREAGGWRRRGSDPGPVLEPGALGTSTTERIALTIAVTRECDGCIAAHAEGAASSGATAGEVPEAMGVAILMNGGPATVFGPRAFAAFREFAAEAPVHRNATGAGPTEPHPHDPGSADAPATATGRPLTDARLDRLLHDLDVANDVPAARGGRPRP
ncbi:carboxymuconolactone decarboxylase family protein [Pseudonocardia abyssalis]|uniref:carboxymuconolactone decarboxylase family protein n=1 Tax=Pseudonocardia abyssalis TaxID=2792008 RepID=UPI001CF69FB3|nr:carboxymuconolactone decarboxylase family protein [Pseudonocardia abyssalis]